MWNVSLNRMLPVLAASKRVFVLSTVKEQQTHIFCIALHRIASRRIVVRSFVRLTKGKVLQAIVFSFARNSCVCLISWFSVFLRALEFPLFTHYNWPLECFLGKCECAPWIHRSSAFIVIKWKQSENKTQWKKPHRK